MDPSSRGHANKPRGIGRRASSDLTSRARLDPLTVATFGRRGCVETGGYRQITAPDGPGGTSGRRRPLTLFEVKRSGTWAGHPTDALAAGASGVPSTIGTDGPLVVPEPVQATRNRATNACLPLTSPPTVVGRHLVPQAGAQVRVSIGRRASRAASISAVTSGSQKVNVHPSPGMDSSSIWLPIASTSLLQMKSPRPAPPTSRCKPVRVRKNRSKTYG